MGIGIGILLTIVAIAAVVWPFLRRRPTEADLEGAPAPALENLRVARGEIYRQIRQLEMDRAAGLVTDREFRMEFDELRSEAAKLLMQESASAGMSDPEAELEREIAEARAALAKAPGKK